MSGVIAPVYHDTGWLPDGTRTVRVGVLVTTMRRDGGVVTRFPASLMRDESFRGQKPYHRPGAPAPFVHPMPCAYCRGTSLDVRGACAGCGAHR